MIYSERDIETLEAELARKRCAVASSHERIAVALRTLGYLTDALASDLAVEAKTAVADERGELQVHLGRLEGGSDKLRREIALLEGRIRRRQLIRGLPGA